LWNIENYHVIWNSQSQNSSESMPVGGHDTGLNVWVEKGEVMFYIDRSGSFDENNQMLKLGRVRLKLNPNPFTENSSFRQELKLKEGCVEIQGKAPYGLQVKVEIWAEVYRPVVHVEVSGSEPIEVTASYENWRLYERELPFDRRHPALSTMGYPGKITTKPDTVQFYGNEVLFYHRNRNDELMFDKVVEQQRLSDVKEKLWNPQKNLIFGGVMYGNGFVPYGTGEGHYLQTPYKAWKLRSETKQAHHHLRIAFNTSQSEAVEQWTGQLKDLTRQAGTDIETHTAVKEWWRAFWERSYIHIHPEHTNREYKSWQVGRNYNLFRFMLGCNAYGNYPTKFNGGLFTTDPCFVLPDAGFEYESADFRRWGGGSFTAQNQRLVYWPMLKSGDFDMMPPQFEYYRRALGNAEERTKIYWEHEGCSFTEQLENFGLPIGWGWGWMDSYDKFHRRTPFSDPTVQIAPWIRYHYVNQLEFAFMMLKYYQYSQIDISAYMPFIESSIRFFDEHYQYRHRMNTTRNLDKDGNLVIFPSTACETYKNATNPADVVAALEATIRAVLELPSDVLSDGQRKYYEELLERVPPLSFREMHGRKTIAPAKHWTEIMNVEIPQLYPVFPYELFGLGKKDLQVAIDTWHYGIETEPQKDHISWHQDNIFCARLGLTEEAAENTIRKLEDGTKRFPAFWGPGHDWLPDHNWGGTGMIGLQDMLMQTKEREILLLPAWPKEWDVDFKLHAPLNTVIEGKTRDGKLLELKVTPETRLKDVVNVWEM
jgi:hypothetical protein